jgi:hypothetical protein
VTLAFVGVSAAVLATSVFLEFERVRIGVVDAPRPSVTRAVTVALPDLTRLAGAPVAIVARVRNLGPEPRTVTLSIETMELARRVIAPGAEEWVRGAVPASMRLSPGTELRVEGDGGGGGWSLVELEAANLFGFSIGLMSFIILPVSASGISAVPPLATGLVTAGLLGVSLGLLSRGRVHRWARVSSLAARGTVLVLFVVVLFLPTVSSYRLEFALHTFLALVAVALLPGIRLPLVGRLGWMLRRVAEIAASSLRGNDRPVGERLDRFDAPVTYVLYLLALTASSTHRTVGDGGEYLDMASSLALLDLPAASVSPHFWMYSAVATPLVALARAVHLEPLFGFTLTNIALLGLAFTVVIRRVSLPIAVLLFAGPIVWWIDKAHTEVFTFSLLTLGIALLRTAPWWSLVVFGLASTQNPSISVLVPLTVVLALSGPQRCRQGRRFWAAVVGATGLALLHPLYFQLARGFPLPLLPSGRLRLSSVPELGSVIWDLNIGLIWSFPGLTVATLVAGLVLLARTRRLSAELVLAVCAAALFLYSFAQTENFNHGGTRHMSRYGLWLVPLTIPLFQRVANDWPAIARRWLPAAALVSSVLTLVTFHPGLPETYLHPTRIAQFVWTRYPAWSDPLPEIFIERLRGADSFWAAAVATSGCEKVLMIGHEDGSGGWPEQCPPMRVPPRCRRPGVFCFANRRGSGYAHVVLPARSYGVRRTDE